MTVSSRSLRSGRQAAADMCAAAHVQHREPRRDGAGPGDHPAEAAGAGVDAPGDDPGDRPGAPLAGPLALAGEQLRHRADPPLDDEGTVLRLDQLITPEPGAGLVMPAGQHILAAGPESGLEDQDLLMDDRIV